MTTGVGVATNFGRAPAISVLGDRYRPRQMLFPASASCSWSIPCSTCRGRSLQMTSSVRGPCFIFNQVIVISGTSFRRLLMRGHYRACHYDACEEMAGSEPWGAGPCNARQPPGVVKSGVTAAYHLAHVASRLQCAKRTGSLFRPTPWKARWLRGVRYGAKLR